MATSPVSIDGTRFRDSRNREITFRGINVAGDAKFPRSPDEPSHNPTDFFEADNVSFVGRPFNEDEAHTHFSRLKRWGYNTIRYIFTWEALEHAGPGHYDEAFIAHTIKMLQIAKSYGFYIFMDPHQDVWSRFSGGSGAPLWTLYACGFDPKAFHATHAAMVHNTSLDPANYPKMIWSTNYTRLVCQTMFTLFFAGKDFAPNAILDGKNIQDWLQDHFIAACKHLAQRIHEAGGLEDSCIIGWESVNEPHCGLIGWKDLSVFPAELKMRKGTCPSPWQALLTGSGRAVEIDTYEFGSFGPYKSGRELVDPEGVSAWISSPEFDERYGWKRDPNWQLGKCLWAQNGVWDPEEDSLLLPHYFSKIPKSGETLDYEKFTNLYFMAYYRKYRESCRSIHKDCIMLLQGPVLELPPSIKGTEDDEKRMIFASHYYDGLTLLTKHWNRLYNVDIFGVLRGRYLSPTFALKIGETAIRNCLRDQLEGIRQEAQKYTGEHPVVFTEIGIPYDMDDKHAYKTGDFSSQTAAMDANHFALEGSGANGYTLWTYVGSNSHEWGDRWNGEDLSIFSLDDTVLPTCPKSVPPSANASTTTLDHNSPSYSASGFNMNSTTNPSNIKDHLKTPSITQGRASSFPELSTTPGLRGAEAFVRPSPVFTHGNVVKYGFDLRNCTFTLTVDANSLTPEDAPTEMFLPDFHFPRGKTNVEVSEGKWRIDVEEVDGEGMQVMRWWHGQGQQSITVKGLKRKLGVVSDEGEDDAGYFESIWRLANNCSVM